MFEKLHDYLSKQIKTAYHTITKSFRLFLPLFFAILLIECTLFTVLLSFRNNIAVRQATVADEYNHHLVVSGLTESEMLLLANDDRTISGNDVCFRVIKTIKYDSTYHDPSYAVYIKIMSGNKNYGIFAPFIDDSLETNYNAMRLRYHDVFGTDEHPNESISLSFTPLYTEEEKSNELQLMCAVSMVAVSLVSAVVFSFLYRIYVNDKKFLLGLYTAFGAGRRDLMTDAMFELSLLALVLILPSYYLSALLSHTVFRAANAPFSFPFFSLSAWLIVLCAVFFILLFGIRGPIGKTFRAEPMKLLSSEENVNPVSSPQRSFSLLNHSFPFGYEGISLLRFRRHHISLAISSALLSILFVFGSYLSLNYADNLRTHRETDPHFTVRFSDTTMMPDEYVSAFRSVDNLSYVYTVPATAMARDYAALLTVSESNVTSVNGLGRDKENGIYYTGDIRFISGASDTKDSIAATYQTEGDLQAFQNDPYGVIIGKTFQNRDTFHFNVGDKVTLAIAVSDPATGEVLYKNEDAPKIKDATGKGFWDAAYENFVFRYVTLTVVGVIEDYPSGTNGVPMVIHPEIYENITGSAPVVTDIAIRAADGISTAQFIEAEGMLRGISSRIGYSTVDTHETFFENRMETLSCYEGLIRTVIFLFLLFIPIIWIYAQMLFFKKREKEFYILSAISAPPSTIRRIYFSGSVMMIPVAILSILFSGILYGCLFLLFERFLPNVLGIGGAISHAVSVPLYVYLIGIFTTLLSCVISVALPYFSFKKKQASETIANDFHSDAH